MEKPVIQIKPYNPALDFFELAKATPGSAGYDIRSAVDYVLQPFEIFAVPTNLCFNLPEGYEAQVRSRSGLSLKGITVFNSPGTIDSDYTGQVKVILRNHTLQEFIINKGDRIAQVVFAKTQEVCSELQDFNKETLRGEGGFGSTEIK